MKKGKKEKETEKENIIRLFVEDIIMNGTPNKTRTHSWRFTSLPC